MSEWETVRRKGGKRRGTQRSGGGHPEGCCSSVACREAPSAPARFLADQALRAASLERTEWFRKTLAEIRRRREACDRIVCYGIGSIYESKNAQQQLAFLTLLQRSYGAAAEAYDPILCTAELDELRGLGVSAGEDVPDGEPATEADDVLYYMPHCPMSLYAKVIKLHRSRLDRLVIVGNSFASYADRRLGKDLDPEIEAALATVVEVNADPGRDDVLERPFNDTSIMSFPPAAAPKAAPAPERAST